MTTALNPSPLPEQPMGDLHYVDYLFINEVEGRYILNLAEDAAFEPRDLMEQVRKVYGCKNVIMTLGSDGSAALYGDEYWTVAPTRVEKVVNTAGAGDGFMAATVAKLVRGESLRDACLLYTSRCV